MKAIDKVSAQTWCRSHGFALDNAGLPALRIAANIEQFSIPQDAGQRVALVAAKMQIFKDEHEVCILLDDWDVWQSGQRWHIFDQFRLSYGITNSLSQKPCYIFRQSDFEAAVSTAVFAVLMLADCHVLGASSRYLFFSHDEYGRNTA